MYSENNNRDNSSVVRFNDSHSKQQASNKGTGTLLVVDLSLFLVVLPVNLCSSRYYQSYPNSPRSCGWLARCALLHHFDDGVSSSKVLSA